MVSPRTSGNEAAGSGENKVAPYARYAGPGRFHPRWSSSCPMIRMSRPPTFQPVDLLQQNHQGQVMGQGLGSEGSHHIATLAKTGAMPIRSPDDPGHLGSSGPFPRLPVFAPLFCAPGITGFVQTHFPPVPRFFLQFTFLLGPLRHVPTFDPGIPLNAFEVFP